MDGSSLRYRWRHSWPEKGEDYVAYDGDLQIGRVYWTLRTPGDPACWRWSLYSLTLPGEMSLLERCRGHSDGTAREAAALLEAVYDEMLPRSLGVSLPLEQEIAHYRRRGIALPWPVHVQKSWHLEGVERFLAEDLHRPASAKLCGGTCMGMDFNHPRP